MNVILRLPSGETITVQDVISDLDQLKQRIEAETTIPIALQELRLAGSPLEVIPEVGDLELDLIVRVGQHYAIGSASLPPVPGSETFRPARSIELAERSASRHGDHAQCMVSHNLRCIYVAIAKNASSTIKAELRRRDTDARERRCAEIPAEVWRDYTTFAFLRDPVTRVLSAYQEISMRLDGKTDDKLPFTKLAPGLERFDAFLDRIETARWDAHARSQVDLIGDHRIDLWGRVDTFQADFTRLLARLGIDSCPTLPQRRSRIGRARDYGYSEHLIWDTDLAPATLQRIRRIYADDLQLLAKLWPQPDSRQRPTSGAWTAPIVRPVRR